MHYWRTANGAEVDLVIEQAGSMALAVECKWKEHPDITDAAGLRALESVEKGRIIVNSFKKIQMKPCVHYAF